VAELFSQRFARRIIVTRHARLRMAERNIDDHMLVDIIDHGQTRFRDPTHLWAFKHFPARNDNLLCTVLVLEDSVVVKTVMHHFELS
jgi:hypothetical protein